jgi:Fe-S-cluster containining protein
MIFPCIQCGLCCREIGNTPALAEFNRGDGVCCHLKNKLCDIYEQRPVICNVQIMYDSFFCTVMDEKTFIQKNLNACIKLAKGNPEIKSKIESVYRQEV